MTAYRGDKQWAPCLHGPDSEQQTAEYVRSVLLTEPTTGMDASKPDLESMLWQIGLGWYEGEQADDVVDVKFSFHADQWVGVACEVHRKSGAVDYLWTEGDSFTVTMAKTIERLKALGVMKKPEEAETEEVTA